jgi:hypothetical protein
VAGDGGGGERNSGRTRLKKRPPIEPVMVGQVPSADRLLAVGSRSNGWVRDKIIQLWTHTSPWLCAPAALASILHAAEVC